MGIKAKLTEVLTRKKAHGDDLRAWLHDRELAASKRAKEEAKNRRTGPRGVNRVPAHLQGLAPTTKYIVKNEDDNYAARRRMAKFTSTRSERTPTEVIAPMRNKREIPNSPVKQVLHKSKSSKGRKTKGTLRSSANRPHVNPRRSIGDY